jgi:hypothetical protein
MATFQRISIEDAQRLAMSPRRGAMAEYRQYVRELNADTAGRIELADGEHPLTIRARLKAAARAEGRELQIQRHGKAIVFWLSDANPQR